MTLSSFRAAGYGLVCFAVPMLGEYIRDCVLRHD